jgi:hypothetical protein
VEDFGTSILRISTLFLNTDSYSSRIKANFWLGKFGVQSEQLGKSKAGFLEINLEQKGAFINQLNYM